MLNVNFYMLNVNFAKPSHPEKETVDVPDLRLGDYFPTEWKVGRMRDFWGPFAQWSKNDILANYWPSVARSTCKKM